MEIKEKIILGVLAVMVLLGGTKAVSAKNIEQDAVVNKVDSIMVSDPSSVSNTYNWGSGTSSITDVYKIHINKYCICESICKFNSLL